MAFRLDIARIDSDKPRRLSDGRLMVQALISRTGVQSYSNDDGSERIEYRPPSEVFHPDSLDSFSALTFTDDHPTERVSTDNAIKYARGWLGETVKPHSDGRHVAATLYIADKRTIAKVDAGKRELSCGYECDLDFTPGVTPDGEPYHAIQRNIRGNHVALVDHGRAGTARVRMDAAVQVANQPAAARGTEGEQKMNLEEALAALGAATKRADAADGKVKELETQLVAAKQDAADAKAATTKAKQDAADVDAGVTARVAKRVKLITDSAPILGSEYKADGKSDREVMAAVVCKVDGEAEGFDKDRSDEFVAGMYAGALKRSGAVAESLARVRGAIVGGQHADAGDTEDKAAADMKADNAKRYQKKGA